MQVAYWCRSLQEETKVCYLNADVGDRAKQVLRFLPKIASIHDIAVMNIVSKHAPVSVLYQKSFSGSLDSLEPTNPTNFGISYAKIN